jgi:hypothetical protein
MAWVDIGQTGIGRPADKRASHALPRPTMGNAREAVFMATPRNPWMAFRDYFLLAESEGIDLTLAAEKLLNGAKASQRALKIVGLRRQWDLPSEAEIREWGRAESRWQALACVREELPETQADERGSIEAEMRSLRIFLETKYDWRERLPRDPQLRAVPKSAWALIESIKPDLTSGWVDDPEDPQEFISVEWLSGTITSQVWFEYEAYEALCVDSTQAMELIKRLVGRAEFSEAPTLPANRKLDHDKIIEQAAEMRTERSLISIGSAAASIVAELPPNPKTGKPRDKRHIERIIAHLWEGGLSQSPP